MGPWLQARKELEAQEVKEAVESGQCEWFVTRPPGRLGLSSWRFKRTQNEYCICICMYACRGTVCISIYLYIYNME